MCSAQYCVLKQNKRDNETCITGKYLNVIFYFLRSCFEPFRCYVQHLPPCSGALSTPIDQRSKSELDTTRNAENNNTDCVKSLCT